MSLAPFKGLTSFHLHILAMTLMLCDHLWATLLPQQEWMTCIGRLAFPIFAFLTVEGYFHTSSIRRYLLRLLVFALISEIPFDLVYGSTLFYPFHQNVLWTFLLGLLCIRFCEFVRSKHRPWLGWAALALAAVMGYLLGTLLMVDYAGAGVLMVLTFYVFRQRTWKSLLGQLLCLGYLNIHMLGTYFYPISIGSWTFELVQQGFAVLALIPIWLYNGARGHHSKAFQYFCYTFYPAHLLVLYVLWQLWM